MTIDRRLEAALPVILDDIGSGGPPAYTDSLLERTVGTRQRATWTFPERWLPSAVAPVGAPVPAARLRLVALVVLLIVALLAAAILAGTGSRHRVPAPFGVADNGVIAYMSGGDLFTADSPAGAGRLLVGGPTYEFRPGYSNDGTMLAFLRRVDPYFDGPTDLVVAHADGTDVRVLTKTPFLEQPPGWSWAPDGRSIVVSTGALDGADYWIFDATGAAEPVLVETGGLAIGTPNFQPPDGRRVLFRGAIGSSVGLYVMDVDGANLAPILGPYPNIHRDEDLQEPVWSPDGRRIAYQQVDATNNMTMRIFVMNADGTGARAVGGSTGPAWNAWPKWSPDSTRILFRRYDPRSPGFNPYSWAVVDVATAAVTAVGPRIDGQTNSGMLWSPSGEQIYALVQADDRRMFIVDPVTGSWNPTAWTIDTADWQRTTH